MTTAVEPDTRCTDALCDALDDNVAPLRALIFDDLIIEMGELFPAEPIDLSFDDEPWRQLPTIEDLQHLWLTSAPIQQMITAVAIKAHGDGGDLPQYMARQWWMAEMELALKNLEVSDVEGTGAVDGGGSAETAPVASAASDGGGGDLPGGSEDGDTVGGSEEATKPANTRRASKVSRGRGSGKA